MQVDWPALGLFIAATFPLLAAPGSVPLALAAAGRRVGWRGSLRFFAGVEIGLAAGAGLTASGLMALLAALPWIEGALVVVALGYLLFLAFRVATAPLGQQAADIALNPVAGAVAGLANPKALAVFAAVFSAFTLIPTHGAADAALKWVLCVALMILVDSIWVSLGIWLGTVRMPPRAERTLNVVFGVLILATALAAYLLT